MYPVEYEVTLYNEIDKKIEKVKGITFAENFADAMSAIEIHYGDELIDAYIFLCEESHVYEFDMMKNTHFHGKFKLNGNITTWKESN